MSQKLDRTKGFMVNAYYCMLVGSNDLCFTWKSIWKQKIPSLVAFFVWIVAWGRLEFKKKEVLDIRGNV